MRELVTITNATVDISDPASEQTGDLWLAVAQSLDLSIDKERREVAIDKAKGLVSNGGALQPAVAVLKEWIQSGEMSPSRQKRFAESLKTSGEPFTMKTLHALMTVAQMEAAREEGGKALTKFKTSLSMEADGVTDGPINALVHMYTGKVNSWYLKTLAKGGWFFDGVTRTRNEQYARDDKDLYQEGADLFNERLGTYIKGLDEENQENAHRVYRVIDALLKGFSIEQWDEKSKAFEIDRKVVKNPLTLMIYGSGKKGVAGKIANEMVGVLYGALSEMVQSGENWKNHELFKDNPQLADDLSVLFNTFYNSKKKQNFRKDSLKVGTDFLENPETGVGARCTQHTKDVRKS